MERPTRRSATAAGANGMNSTSHSSGHSSHSNGGSSNNNSNSSSSRRRRREAERGSGGGAGAGGGGASASDGAETDSSSVAVEVGTTRSAKTSHKKGKSSTQRTTSDSDHVNGSHSANGLAKALLDAVANGEPADLEDEDEQDEEEEEEEEEEAPTGYATRARRERSQSVVSTTSDTSSIASEHPDEHLRPELHDEKLQELEKKKQMVEEGTLAEYCRRVAEFKEERNRLLQTAEWHKNLQLKNTQDLYGFEVQRAHNIWQDTKDKLKDSMLAKADALLLQLKQEMEILNKTTQLPLHVVATKKALILPSVKSTSASASAGNPASPGNLDEPEPFSSPDAVDAVQTLPPSSKRRKTSAPVPDNVLRLPLDDITSDLASIVQARDSASATLHAALPAPRLEVRVDRRRLLCGKYVFEEGDEVVVTTAVLKEDYIGVVSSVSDVELYVQLSTGQKVRVAVDHIALRRCEIRPFLRGSAGIESLQCSGWVECEPF